VEAVENPVLPGQEEDEVVNLADGRLPNGRLRPAPAQAAEAEGGLAARTAARARTAIGNTVVGRTVARTYNGAGEAVGRGAARVAGAAEALASKVPYGMEALGLGARAVGGVSSVLAAPEVAFAMAAVPAAISMGKEINEMNSKDPRVQYAFQEAYGDNNAKNWFRQLGDYAVDIGSLGFYDPQDKRFQKGLKKYDETLKQGQEYAAPFLAKAEAENEASLQQTRAEQQAADERMHQQSLSNLGMARSRGVARTTPAPMNKWNS
jgi:hypothetical protein